MSVETTGGHPAMDYRQHTRTYAGFITGLKIGIGVVVAILAGMAVFLL